MSRVIIFVFSLLIISVPIQADQLKVLFLGNSYIGTGNLPVTLANLAASNGDVLIHDRNTPGGHTLQGHSTNGTSITKINSNDWDYVVLQEQSQLPSFPQSQVAAQSYPYAAQLNTMIKANNPCTETVFYMTWGRENGDANNCSVWPPVCTFEGMQAQLRLSYLTMGVDNDATVAPVGVAWKNVRDSTAAIDLYNNDGSHPSTRGVYLTSCVFYATLFQKSPIGLSFTNGLPAAEAVILQYIAHHTVFDSTDNWFINKNWEPQNPTTTNVTLNSAVLNWDPVPNAHHYKIRGRQVGGSAWTHLLVPPAVTQKQVFGLSGNTSYEWQVIAHCDSAEHFDYAWSELATFTIECPATPGIWTDPVSTNSAALNWSPTALNVSGFEIRGKRVGAPSWTTLLVPGTQNFKVVFGLQPNTSYQWTVRSWCDTSGTYVSDWAVLDTFTTSSTNARHSPVGGGTNEGSGHGFVQNPTRSFASDQDDGFDGTGMTEGLSVFPNPTQNNLNITLANDEIVELKIWNAAGELIYMANPSISHLLLTTHEWPRGIYLLILEGKSTTYYQQLVKH